MTLTVFKSSQRVFVYVRQRPSVFETSALASRFCHGRPPEFAGLAVNLAVNRVRYSLWGLPGHTAIWWRFLETSKAPKGHRRHWSPG